MAHYENVGEPTLQKLQVFWFGEQKTAKGHMRRGQVLADDGKTGLAALIEFNGPKRPDGECHGMFQIVEVTPNSGDTYVQYQLLGAKKTAG